MSDTVVIKKVERKTIVLEDTYTYQFTTKSLIYIFICFFTLLIVGYGIGKCMLPNDPNTFLYPYSAEALGLAWASICTLIFSTMFQERIPAYSVRILYSMSNPHIIPKTTTESDQIAICRVAKELETEALELTRIEREMEQIAMKCK